MLLSKNVNMEKVDGAMPENKTQRDVLFGVSSIRGKYPQVFIQTGETFVFVGDWDLIQELVEVKTIHQCSILTVFAFSN